MKVFRVVMFLFCSDNPLRRISVGIDSTGNFISAKLREIYP